MSTTMQVASAAGWLWTGMVLAISFLEAPLKFRTPGLELRTGLAIGRIVFRALNIAEIGWALLIGVCLVLERPEVSVVALAVAAGVLLAVQLGVVRPRLNRRSDQVLAGGDAPRSSSHHVYIVLEVAKVLLLVALGVAIFAA